MGHVAQQLGTAGGQQAVALADLHLGGGDAQRGRHRQAGLLAATFGIGRENTSFGGDAGAAEVGGFVAEDLAGHRLDQRLGLAIDVPVGDAGQDAGGEDGVAGAGEDAAFLGRHDDAGVGVLLVIDHQRLGQEGLDRAHRDALDRALGRLGIDLRETLLVEGAVARQRAADALADLERRRRPAAVEDDDLARVDEVRVADFLAVQAPDFGPAPGFLQELAGDAPQGIARHHHVAVGSVVGQTDRAGCTHACRNQGSDAR